MRIKKIIVNGFKSLVSFEMEFAKFTCLIGLNGSGKSTVLQFIDFLSQLARGDMEGWFKERRWEVYDVRSELISKQTIDFEVELEVDGEHFLAWKARYNIYERKCTQEFFTVRTTVREREQHAFLMRAKSQKLRTWESSGPGILDVKSHSEKIAFEYQGSVLSQLKDETLPALLREVRSFLRNVNSFDMLAPQSLRRRDRASGGSIGLSGQRLSAFLAELIPDKRRSIAEELKKAYPSLENVFTKSVQSGWKQLLISENYKKGGMRTEARHVNDGMLRLIAFLAELKSEHEFLLFDEIENGINPELVDFLIGILTKAKQQIMVTTHSPIILNYLEDEEARESVVYLYKNTEGETRSIRFFDIPSISEKLNVLGPGEAFVDTNLLELANEISTL